MTKLSSVTAPTSDNREIFISTKQRRQLAEEQVKANDVSFGTGLAGLLAVAYAETNEEAPQSPTETRDFKRSQDKHAVRWNHPLFGSLEIDMGELELSEVVTKGPNMCSRVYFFAQPDYLALDIRVQAADGVRILHAKAGQVDEVTTGDVPILAVPITWNGQGQPHTRERDKDNVDVVFINKDGMFVQLQVSLVTRKKRFWICVQEIYSGQVVRTNHAKAKQLNVSYHPVGSHAGLIVPLYAENAYAGADYLKSNPRMGGKVIEQAIEWGSVVPMGDAVVASWQPEDVALPADIAAKGYVPAVVTWFNLVIGYGFAVLPSGQSCYVHFNEVLDKKGNRIAEEGECPMLQPMKAIAVKYQDGPKPKATAIRVL